ncbi:MAG: diguanylate cyclase [Candidatus Orphnella occulta]|nr:diguanylate cyclase [Candidatus Orphnella occulta]
MSDEFNILVVEDDENIFKVLNKTFIGDRYKLWRVTTGKEALNLIKEIHFVAIISELHIADIDGIELIKRINKIDPRVNIIVLTAYSFANSAVKALEAGAYAYLLKPLNSEELKLILRRSIENTCLLIQVGKKKYYQDISILDGLTSVYNHRRFHEILEWQIDHMKRLPQAFSLFIIDIDNFKKYNDTHGHVEGDKVLHNVAQLLVTLTRDTDTVFRYGGEEFTVIMPQTPNQEAQIVGQRLIEGVRRQSSITISIGLSTFPDDTHVKEVLVVKADKALYRAKRLGRDQLCVYDKNMDK